MNNPNRNTTIQADHINVYEGSPEGPSAKVPREELLWQFQRVASEFLSGLDPEIVDEGVVTDSLLPLILSEVPPSAFERVTPEDEGIVFAQGEITMESSAALSRELMQAHLNLAKGKPVMLYLSSDGGDVFAGMGIISTIFELQRQGRAVNIHIQGYALSMASLVLQAANHRSIDKSAYLMLHELSSGIQGKLSAQTEEVQFNKRLEQTCLELYSARSGKPTAYYADKTKKRDWYLSSDEALAEGLVDEVRPWPLFSLKDVKPLPKRKRKTATPASPAEPTKETNVTSSPVP